MPSLIAYRWDGNVMAPLPRFERHCDREFTVGEIYLLDPIEQRSAASHRHYFSCINTAWQSLPEDLAGRFPSPEHLRKYALIQCGYADEQSIVCASKAEAARVAAFIRPIDEYSIVTVSECVVTRYTAKSQSHKAMGRKAFAESKDRVLDYVSSLIGTDVTALRSNAGRAA